MRSLKTAKKLRVYWAGMVALLLLSGCTGALLPTPSPAETPVGAPSNPQSTEETPEETPAETAEETPVDAPTAPPVSESPADEPASEGTSSEEGIEVAERVDFEGGSNSAMRSGTLALGDDKQYAVAASAGQTLHVQTISPDAPVNFTVYGPGGVSWTGEFGPSEVYIFTSQFTIPENADYLVVLSVTEDSEASLPETMPESANYEVVFTVDTAVSPTDPQVDPVDRISFDPTTNTAERSGMLPSGPGGLQFLISANVDRILTVDATSDGTPLSMTIESPSGNQWIPEMMTAPDGYTIGQQITLPEPGYYLVTLNKGDNTPSTNYTITFTLE